jgi:hypothetical protein
MDSPAHVALSTVPALVLLALGCTWSRWPTGWQEVPATALSLGLALLMLLVMVAAMYGAKVELLQALPPAALIVVPVLCYLGVVFQFSRRSGVSTKRLVLLGLVGLAPGYHLLGFALVNSACGFESAGC